MKQLIIHKKIKEFFKTDINLANIKVAQELLANYDAKQFFFSQADESWISWLWENGFLDEIKKKTEDTSKLFYHLPELDYLTRMIEKNPVKVTEIILNKETATKEDNFNPEIVDRFLWIISMLPAEQTKLIVNKIKDENWVYLMRNFRKSGYEFERIIKGLVEKKESSAILEIAKALLVVKNKEEISNKNSSFNIYTDNVFYASDLDASGVFEALVNIGKPYEEEALKITTEVMTKIIELSEVDETKIFKHNDLYSLFDVDFFSLGIENKRSYSSDREDVKNLAATIKGLVEITIGKKCGDEQEAKRLFEYINKLPSCRSMWRLRLFTLSQCPEIFKEEIKNSLFKLFEVDNYFEIESGTEYQKTLSIAFTYLSDADQRTYVANVIEYFSKKIEQYSDQKWHKRTGWEILSCICAHLTNDEHKKCEEVFGSKCNEKYEPEPEIGKSRGGIVQHISPVNLDDYTIKKIITNLKTEWTPEKLNEQFKGDDFLAPRGVEGLGDALKENIKKRMDEYLLNINNFFDIDNIHSHYVYSLLRGIEETLRNKQPLTLKQINQILGLFESIKNKGEENPFRRKDDKSWLVDWVETHKVITDILLFILENKELKAEVQKIYREQIKNLISYLLTIKDSPSKENEKPEYGEPYHVAINSVRGRAYEAFVIFTENDEKVLAEDVKNIFKTTLKDDSLAVRFVIGRYLATFYFRDKDFIISLLLDIFPKDDPSKKDIYLASWEGYLSNTLYNEIFTTLNKFYSHAITLEPKNYTERKYSKGLDESLAIHISLAFMYLGLKFEDPLFVQFWDAPNETRHHEFVSFIGRSCLTRDQAGGELLEKNKVSKEKLITFWDWLLEKNFEPKTYSGFGLWINPNKEVLSEQDIVKRLPKTLEKSQGDIDWDYGFTRRLKIFAELNPENTLKSIESYLLTSDGNLNPHRGLPLFSIDSEIKDALSICYKNKKTKQSVEELINKLIEKGGKIFWGLEDIIQ